MRCHYEVLAVQKHASDAEIKRAYRLRALACHPDKAVQQGLDVEDANKLFREVQNAYDVLSNAHERAWLVQSPMGELKGAGTIITETLSLPGQTRATLMARRMHPRPRHRRRHHCGDVLSFDRTN